MSGQLPGDAIAAETLGRLVRDAWVAWAREQPDPKPSWLVGWDDLDDGQREVDMRIGQAIAAQVAAAEREAIRREAQDWYGLSFAAKVTEMLTRRAADLLVGGAQ